MAYSTRPESRHAPSNQITASVIVFPSTIASTMSLANTRSPAGVVIIVKRSTSKRSGWSCMTLPSALSVISLADKKRRPNLSQTR